MSTTEMMIIMILIAISTDNLSFVVLKPLGTSTRRAECRPVAYHRMVPAFNTITASLLTIQLMPQR